MKATEKPLGQKVEDALFLALEDHLLFIRNPYLDSRQIDALIVGIKINSLMHLGFPRALQITTKPDWDKRAGFLEMMPNNSDGPSALLELDLRLDEQGKISPKNTKRILAVLFDLFFKKSSPKHALISITESDVQTRDLEIELETYKKWLDVQLQEKLFGVITFWRWYKQGVDDPAEFADNAIDTKDNTEAPFSALTRKGFGFIRLYNPSTRKPLDTNGEPTIFHVHGGNVSGKLLERLNDQEGDLTNRADKILVSFFDGGRRRGHLRKSAVQVEPISPRKK